MNLGGIPPFSGFLGKLGAAEAGVAARHAAGLGAGRRRLLTSLLTLLAMARVWNRAFWRKPEDAEHPDPVLLAAKPDGSAVRTTRHVEERPHGRFTGRGIVQLPPMRWSGRRSGLVVLGVALTVFAGPLFG